MPRPMMLGIVGDSGSGKTTLVRGLARVLGDDAITRVSADDYHRHERRRRAELDITPLDPAANYVDVLELDVERLRAGQPILKPVYRHADGSFGPPAYVRPTRFCIVEGLLTLHTDGLRAHFDCAVYLDPPEQLRRSWKVLRDTTRRGYTTDEVLSELDRRERDAARWVRPQREWADIVISFSGAAGDQQHLDVDLTLRPTLPHPDLSGLVGSSGDDLALVVAPDGTQLLRVPGRLPAGRAEEIEAAIWERLHFARHLRTDRLGEFTRGNDLLRSDALAITQLLVIHQMATVRAAIALGAS